MYMHAPVFIAYQVCYKISQENYKYEPIVSILHCIETLDIVLMCTVQIHTKWVCIYKLFPCEFSNDKG